MTLLVFAILIIAGALLQVPPPAGIQVPAWMVSGPALVAAAFLGMFAHFLKKNIKGETTTEIRDYFADHFKSTFLAAITSVILTLGFFAMATGTAADLVTCFLLGLGCDSSLNTWEAKANPDGRELSP